MWSSRFFFLTKQREGPEKFSDRSGLRWSHSFIHSYLIPLPEKMNNPAVTWCEYMNFAYMNCGVKRTFSVWPRSSERYLSRSAEKGLITVFEPWPLRCRCSATSVELSGQIGVDCYRDTPDKYCTSIIYGGVILSWNNITTSSQLDWQLKLIDCTGIRSLSS